MVDFKTKELNKVNQIKRRPNNVTDEWKLDFLLCLEKKTSTLKNFLA